MKRRFASSLSWCLVAWVAAHSAASAQERPFLETSFSSPGARSLSLGGAFVAMADDATAAFANPSGLVQLARPEVSIELCLPRRRVARWRC